MKRKTLVFFLFLFLTSNVSFSQFISTEIPSLKKSGSQIKSISAKKIPPALGFNLGVASIEGEVGFAIGTFAEFQGGDVSFVPQANYWKVNDQSNFELAGLARFYLGDRPLIPYIDGGLGVNFYSSDAQDFTKLSILAGAGLEMTNVSKSFSLLVDGKYKLIVNDRGNFSCFIFTIGMKFPIK